MDEWPQDFVIDESLYQLLSSSPQLESDPQEAEWTFDENRLFESVLSEVSPTSPTLFESIVQRIPWKTIEEVKDHYQDMFEDLTMMESGNVLYPTYPEDIDINAAHHSVPNKDADELSADPKGKGKAKAKAKSTAHRRRGVPWTEDEHQLFLMGLNKYGKGDWRSISRFYVISKTPTQVASHAQKYFRRLTSSTPADRRRPSIHDIQTVNPTPTPIPQRPTTVEPAPTLPNYGYGYISPTMFMQHYHQQQQQNINPSYMNNNNGAGPSSYADGAGPSNYANGAGPSNYADGAGPSNYAELAAAMFPSTMEDQQYYWG